MRLRARGGRRRVGNNPRGRADGGPRPWSSTLLSPLRSRLMARAPDLGGGDSSHGGPPEVQSQDAGNATAQHGREADLRPAQGLRCSARAERVRHQRDHGGGGNHQDRRDAGHRSPIDVAETDRRCGARAVIRVFANRRPPDRALELRRLLAPEVRRTGWRLVGLGGCGPGTERHQFLAGPEPVAREAHDLAPGLSRSLSCLGLLTLSHR